MLPQLLQSLARPIERSLYPQLFSDRCGVIGVLLHSVFGSEREIARDHVFPMEHATVARLRRFVEHFLDHGYRFLLPADLTGNLSPPQRVVLLTFDDGYANFLHVVPLLDEYGIRATLFPVSHNVEKNEGFWWDVVYRLERKAGRSPGAIEQKLAALRGLTCDEVRRRVTDRYGQRSLQPLGDLDRPLTADELKELADNPRVCIGNHTANHANLLMHSAEGVMEQITRAQVTLREMTGKTPRAISYPFGVVSAEIAEAARRAGLSLGFTTHSHPMGIPQDLGLNARLRLGRYTPALRDGNNAAREIRHQVLVTQIRRSLWAGWRRQNEPVRN
jgi:peptidoglycan/xylan/chitin deacetylase (PgdA/CDA1 family)